MSLSGNKPRAPIKGAEKGMALIVSLIFLLLLTLIGISSMQNANLQEKMSGSVKLRNESFQYAEAAVRAGESVVQLSSYKLLVCSKCAPPPDASSVVAAGTSGVSGVTWVASSITVAGASRITGYYAVQKFATTRDPVNINLVGTDESKSWTLYRITGVGLQGNSRTVVESIYAKR
ncbi:pilus assembly PilX family protein [Pseudomonas huanghezhanensis]|uniref:pilus assembly PilX family protein n=1 Tax=Pseudomonas huanghezhanensis TaxID=3002903 RepID=UPI0022854D76|nr:PilX N-terminal domain-containing pilus assembly protein [Pseudomonas sp. BSw22131]